MALRLKETAWFELYKAALTGACSLSVADSGNFNECNYARNTADEAEVDVCRRCPSLIDIERSTEPRPDKIEPGQWWLVRLYNLEPGGPVTCAAAVDSVDTDGITTVLAFGKSKKMRGANEWVAYLGKP